MTSARLFVLAFPLLVVSAAAACAGTADEDTASRSASAVVVSGDIVISQLYGGGGNQTSTFTNDYVELFNRSHAAVSLAGKSLQYANAKKNFSVVVGAAVADDVALPSVVLAPGQHFLVQLNEGQYDGGLVGGQRLPRPDFAAPAANAIAMNKEKGKVALVPSNALLNGCGATETPCQATAWIDLVGYGEASLAEGTTVGALGNTTAAVRRNNGCLDTGNNAADFAIAEPTPRTMASPATPCP